MGNAELCGDSSHIKSLIRRLWPKPMIDGQRHEIPPRIFRPTGCKEQKSQRIRPPGNSHRESLPRLKPGHGHIKSGGQNHLRGIRLSSHRP